MVTWGTKDKTQRLVMTGCHLGGLSKLPQTRGGRIPGESRRGPKCPAALSYICRSDTGPRTFRPPPSPPLGRRGNERVRRHRVSKDALAAVTNRPLRRSWLKHIDECPEQLFQVRETASSSSEPGVWPLSALFPSFHQHLWHAARDHRAHLHAASRREQGRWPWEGLVDSGSSPNALRRGHVTESSPWSANRSMSLIGTSEGEMDLINHDCFLPHSQAFQPNPGYHGELSGKDDGYNNNSNDDDDGGGGVMWTVSTPRPVSTHPNLGITPPPFSANWFQRGCHP